MILFLPNGNKLDLQSIIRDLVVEKQKQGFGVFVFKVYGLSKEVFQEKIFIHKKYDEYELVLTFTESFSYLDEVKINIHNENGEFNLTNPQEKHAQPGVYLFVLIPTNEITVEIEDHVKEICSILAMSIGKNIIHKHFMSMFNFIESRGQIYSTPIDLGKYNSIPSLDKFNHNEEIHKKLQALQVEDKNRVKISLRWYYKALFEEGVDSFISFWIAIETIGKANGSNIKPINVLLGNIYNLTYEEANIKFGTGRLCGIRSNIVHFGKMPNINHVFLDFVEALYVDLLYEVLKIKSEKRLLEKLGTINLLDYSEKQK